MAEVRRSRSVSFKWKRDVLIIKIKTNVEGRESEKACVFASIRGQYDLGEENKNLMNHYIISAYKKA